MKGSHHLYLAAYVSRDDDDDFALHPVVAAAQLGRARIRGYGYGWTSSLKHLTEAKAERSTRSSSTVEDTLSIALFLELAGLSADIVFPIAAFASHQVRSRNWFYGVSLSVDLETVHVLEEPDFLDGEMILNDDTGAVGDYYEEPFASTGHGNVGMSQQEISMLKTERLSDDEDEDGECCSICLEGFMRGMVITKLPPCSHRFYNACIAQWLHKNPTCPIQFVAAHVHSLFHKCKS
nr:E3 ubiquitin-protein ligase At4g11680-like [Ipomoea batatas]GMD70365.1 E3 ubiquitin-protein ligase At4g11680-like [Ipomoea batatas]